jgi:hypothetical protein
VVRLPIVGLRKGNPVCLFRGVLHLLNLNLPACVVVRIRITVRLFRCSGNRKPGLRLESGRVCEMDELVLYSI